MKSFEKRIYKTFIKKLKELYENDLITEYCIRNGKMIVTYRENDTKQKHLFEQIWEDDDE